MAQKIVLIGDPIVHDRTLAILREKYGARKGYEVYKSTLALKALGWWGLKKILDRASILRLRRDLAGAGLLGGVYEEDVDVEDMLELMEG